MEIKPSLDYLAGFFDGEGTICVLRGYGTSYYMLQVCVSNTVRDVLDNYRQRYGGSVVCVKRSDNHKDIYQWRIHAAKTEKFLAEIGPLLRQKQDQVQLALRFRKLGVLPRGRIVNDIERQRLKREAILAQRQECYEQMALLNKRGIA